MKFSYSAVALAAVAWSTKVQADGEPLCGCNECSDVLDSLADGYSCRDRILYLVNEQSLDEVDACLRVGGMEFTNECGKCQCGVRPSLDEYENGGPLCGCPGCTSDYLNTMADGYSCGDRITYVTDVMQQSMQEACTLVAGTQFPNECGLCDPIECSSTSLIDVVPSIDDEAKEEESASADLEMMFGTTVDGLRCGCNSCTGEVWESDAGGFTCGARIEWLLGQSLGSSIEDACAQVAAAEYANPCGGCNPLTCDGKDDGLTEMTLTARTPLYCFPSFQNRTRFRNMWGNYTVEVKESGAGVCGPSDNKFTTETVSHVGKDKIKLQFKKVDDVWAGSEIRLRLPESQVPFVYGKYSFSIGSVEVVDTTTDTVISNVLPPSLILGLFTWDDTENYAAKENFNHEVDIEISRWNNPDNADLQFLVQPPGEPQQARFFSGPNDTYKQASRTLEFDWRPGEIAWTGDRGETHVYSTQIALDAGTPDFTQCLPADMEVRMNLWNLFGTAQPTEMEDHHMVEVVIEGFSYTPSGLASVEEGGVCAKDCQCGSVADCIDNTCQKIGDRRTLQHVTSDDTSRFVDRAQRPAASYPNLLRMTSSESHTERSGASLQWTATAASIFSLVLAFF